MTKKGKHGYRETVWYVAMNDEPNDFDPESVRDAISTDVIAYVFGKTPERVAEDIVRVRESEMGSPESDWVD